MRYKPLKGVWQASTPKTPIGLSTRYRYALYSKDGKAIAMTNDIFTAIAWRGRVTALEKLH